MEETTCTACKRGGLVIAARGMCRACYQRWWKRGTADYAPIRVRHSCHMKDCDDPVVSHGLCDKHRNRLRRHGHTEQTRPDSWGAKNKHPLYNSWAWMRRHRGVSAVIAEWRDDFLQFVVDVGERPSKKHKLFPADESKPLGPGNFIWKTSITARVDGEDGLSYRARQQRIYRKMRPEAFCGYELKKRFGLTKEQYDEMYGLYGGKCAICGRQEEATIRGSKIRLSVDHCHETGAIRGLLCSFCNRALGGFKDSPELLESAKNYLLKSRN